MRIVIEEGKGCNNKVKAIKSVRVLTGLGLKEAKDAVELAMGGRTFEADVGPGDDETLDMAIRDIEDTGLHIIILNGGERTLFEVERKLKEVARLCYESELYAINASVQLALARVKQEKH